MAIDVVLQDSQGRKLEYVGYPIGVPNTLIPFDDESFPYLGYVDPYRDTIFNHLQMKPFLLDWARLYVKASLEAEINFLRQVEVLAQKCHTGLCLSLKLMGD